jgi:hypothetical protein
VIRKRARLWIVAAATVLVVAAWSEYDHQEAHGEAEIGIRLPVELEATTTRVLSTREAQIPSLVARGLRPGDVIRVTEVEKALAGQFAGMQARGRAIVVMEVRFKTVSPVPQTETVAFTREAQLETAAGTARLIFAPSAGASTVFDAYDATGALKGVLMRGLLESKELESRRSLLTGFAILGGSRPELTARFRDVLPELTEMIATARTALLPFPVAARAEGLQTAARLRVWLEPNGPTFEMYLLVGQAGGSGAKQMVRVTIAGPGTPERVLLEGAYDPGTQVRLAGPASVPGIILVSQEGRAVVQLPISEQDVSK